MSSPSFPQKNASFLILLFFRWEGPPAFRLLILVEYRGGQKETGFCRWGRGPRCATNDLTSGAVPIVGVGFRRETRIDLNCVAPKMAENIPQDAAFERSYKVETSFINHVPKTREEREALRDKDKLEKGRLEVGWTPRSVEPRAESRGNALAPFSKSL